MQRQGSRHGEISFGAASGSRNGDFVLSRPQSHLGGIKRDLRRINNDTPVEGSGRFELFRSGEVSTGEGEGRSGVDDFPGIRSAAAAESSGNSLLDIVTYGVADDGGIDN